MQIENTMYCNVCLASSKDSPHAVFIRAHKDLKPVDICTNCIPSVIHGSGLVVKSDEEVLKDLA